MWVCLRPNDLYINRWAEPPLFNQLYSVCRLVRVCLVLQSPNKYMADKTHPARRNNKIVKTNIQIMVSAQLCIGNFLQSTGECLSRCLLTSTGLAYCLVVVYAFNLIK